jgi:hypothetical protein
MRHIKLFENWFQDMEDLVRQERNKESRQSVPKQMAAKPVDQEDADEPKVEEPIETTPKQGEQPEEPKKEEPKDFRGWLASQAGVKAVKEAEDSDLASKCWVDLENGVSAKWEISMEDYPFLSASFKQDNIVIEFADDPAGDIARELYKKTREYESKAWAQAVIKAGLQVPQTILDAEKKGKTRISDWDDAISAVITDILG